MKVDFELAKKFINYYYTTENYVLPSISNLSTMFDVQDHKIRTLLSLFQICGFVYKFNKKYHIYETKRNFDTNFVVKTDEKYIKVVGSNFKITFDKFEYDVLVEEKLDTSIKDVKFYVLAIFLFNAKEEMSYNQEIIIKNDIMWVKKNCYLGKNTKWVMTCEFTQNTDSILLYNT